MLDELEMIVIHEGGLVNDKRDRGGITYKGIARKFHGDWDGWEIVDEALNSNRNDITLANNDLSRDGYLHAMVIEFYKVNYWDKVRGDDIGLDLGFQVTDCAVNCGVRRAIKMLQQCLGVIDDGIIGKKTIGSLGLVNDKLQFILDYNELRRDYYRSLKQFDIYGRGWLNRVDRNDDIAMEALK